MESGIYQFWMRTSLIKFQSKLSRGAGNIQNIQLVHIHHLQGWTFPFSVRKVQGEARSTQGKLPCAQAVCGADIPPFWHLGAGGGVETGKEERSQIPLQRAGMSCRNPSAARVPLPSLLTPSCPDSSPHPALTPHPCPCSSPHPALNPHPILPAHSSGHGTQTHLGSTRCAGIREQHIPPRCASRN